MLFTSLGVLVGIYVSKRWFDARQPSKPIVHSNTNAVVLVDNSVPQLDESLQHTKISVASVFVASAGAFLYPPISLLALGVISYNAVPILQRSLQALRSNEKKIDNDSYSSLITLILVGSGNFFAAAMHNVLYHSSHYLIAKSKKDSVSLIENAYQQAPETVWISIDNVEKQIPLEQVEAGDSIIVTTGTTIPVDGIIIQGEALVDQQALTGEANPMEKNIGDHVMAATIVLSGRIVIKAIHHGAETRINKLNEVLLQTRDYKTGLQLKGEAWADRAALPLMATSVALVPVLGMSKAFALLFVAPMNTVRSMLSVQTTAHMQGIMQHGAFIKDGRVLEELPKIDTILFDKTGTLTQTHPEVTNIITCGLLDADTLLLFAAAAEQRLDHPIALAIVGKAKELELVLPEVDHSNYSLGLGVTVEIGGYEILVGSQRFIQKSTKNQELPTAIEDAMKASVGHTFILIAVNGDIQGALELTPSLRPEVPSVIKHLRERGFEHLAIVSGDQQAPTQRLVDSLGLDAAYGEVLPQGKAALIKALQDQGHRVCFVGDGLNDAIAMKQANVSVCLSSASAITSEVAQIVLQNDSLEPFARLFDISKDLHKNLNNSLYFWIGFGVTHAVAVPIMAFGPSQSSLVYGAAYATGVKVSERYRG